MARVAINGLGRIGRAAFKIVLDNSELQIGAVNDLVALDNLAYLLKYDTVYGRYEKTVEHRENMLVIDDQEYRVFNEKDPARLPWGELDIDVVFECTGVFRDLEGLEKHIQAGAKHVILSAPGKGEDMPMVVHRVNEPEVPPRIISCASCTTNCITPVVEIMGRHFDVKKAMMTTIHAYTSSQAIVDSPRSKWRRGRAGAANFVPTSTGAAKATTKALPQYEGRFDGVAVRGPVPVGSLADMVFLVDRQTNSDKVNEIFREESQTDRYHGILGVSEDPIVSSDIIKDPRASIVDLTMTQIVDGDMVKVMSWYDNEWGYTNQMVREAIRITKML
jgi:glyceraldehyde 3-phosphate dehydrogenase